MDCGAYPIRIAGMLKPARRKTLIRDWRLFRNLTQEQLAEAAGMSTGNLSMLERGVQGYSQNNLERLSEALGCEPADLLNRHPEDPEGVWSVWKKLDSGDRTRALAILRALAQAEAPEREESSPA